MFAFEALALVGEQLSFGGGVIVVGGNFGSDGLTEAVGLVRGHLDASVEVLDLGFELVGCHVALLAAGDLAAVLLTEAVEVGVGALRVLDRQAPPAHLRQDVAGDMQRNDLVVATEHGLY